MATILRTDQENPAEDEVREGARVIREGGLVVFPTETVYGLGANAFSEEACRKIFKAKERPADNPLIVHISSLDRLNEVAENVPHDLIGKLEKVWPGPVTLLFHKGSLIPDLVTGGSSLVAVRIPANKLALRLIELAGVPIAAPSANVSTRPSITDSRYAISELEGRVDLIFDSGPTSRGLESTIIDVSGKTPVLLRAGSKPVEELKEIFGDIEVTDFARGMLESSIPLAPGMKYRHYSPNKKLFLASSLELLHIVAGNDSLKGRVVIMGSDELCASSSLACIKLGPEGDHHQAGRRLFSALRELEQLPEPVGVIMPFSEAGTGLAIMNRIRKASTAAFSSLEELQKLIF